MLKTWLQYQAFKELKINPETNTIRMQWNKPKIVNESQSDHKQGFL